MKRKHAFSIGFTDRVTIIRQRDRDTRIASKVQRKESAVYVFLTSSSWIELEQYLNNVRRNWPSLAPPQARGTLYLVVEKEHEKE